MFGLVSLIIFLISIKQKAKMFGENYTLSPQLVSAVAVKHHFHQAAIQNFQNENC